MAGMVPYKKGKGLSFPAMVDEFFGEPFFPRNVMGMSFRLDVQEDEKQYTVEAELPGLSKEQISLEIDDGVLSISTVQDEVKDEEEKNYVHRERRMSSMQRSVYLENASDKGIEATLEGGVLKIEVPKAKKTEKRDKKIQIK